MTTDHRTFIVADWLEDDRPGAPSRQLPAFEGILTGRWNGFAEWKTNRRVIEAYISELERLRALDPSHFEEDGGLDRWFFDDNMLHIWDDGEAPYWIAPDDDGFYHIGLGMVWTTYDQYDVNADLSTYTLYRMEGEVPDPEVRSYLSDLIDTNDDGQEVEFGYDPDVRERAIAWLQSFDQH